MQTPEPSVAAKGGLSTRIRVNALSNPLGFHLTPEPTCDLEGADEVLPDLVAETVLADKAQGTDQRVLHLGSLDDTSQGKVGMRVIQIYIQHRPNSVPKFSLRRGVGNFSPLIAATVEQLNLAAILLN